MVWFAVADDSYVSVVGNDMAPYTVAGVAAQFLSDNPEATPAEVKVIFLEQSCRHFLSSPSRQVGC